jgi:RimJ/RimL family protein N-acetyltransferase
MTMLAQQELRQPRVIGSILVDADEFVTQFVRVRIDHVRERGFGPCTALGVVRRGQFLGGIVFHNYMGHSIEVSWAFDHPSWCLPQTMRALFWYPFKTLDCVRLTCIAPRGNKRSRRAVIGLGFKLEGVHPKGLDGKQDAISYGMLRDDCRWIRN